MGGVTYAAGARYSRTEEIVSETQPLLVTAYVEYCHASSSENTHTENMALGSLQVNLFPLDGRTIRQNSVTFTLAGKTYWDYNGLLYHGGAYDVGAGTLAGSINYRTGVARITEWDAGSNAVDIKSLLLQKRPRLLGGFTTYTAIAPIQPMSLTISVTDEHGNVLNGTSAVDGSISGSMMRGFIDTDTGVIDVEFGHLVTDSELTAADKAMDWYDPDAVEAGQIWLPAAVDITTGRYNCVSYVYLPLSAEILGIDPIRLPMDGKVPLYRVGDVIVIHHTQETTVGTVTNGQVIDVNRTRIAWAIVHNADDSLVNTADYTVDLDAGTVTLDDVSSMTAPIKIVDRIEDMALVDDLQINGTLGITKALSHDYPMGSYASSALITTDLFARITNIFEQSSWTGVWSDVVIGNEPLAAFNNTDHPITITNKGGTQERWMVKFTSNDTFDIYGEYSGKINATSLSVHDDCSPQNTATGAPYFTIPALGWGSGWSTGNIVRFNTIAANRPVWVARTVLQSEAYSGTDTFCIEIRGDVDTP